MPTIVEYDELKAECTSVSNGGGFGNAGGAPAGNTGGKDNAHGYWPVPSGRWLGIGASNNSNQVEHKPAGPTLYFPAGGNRYADGNTSTAGYYGYSWSGSSCDATRANRLLVGSSSVTRGNIGRSNGFTVRCIRE